MRITATDRGGFSAEVRSGCSTLWDGYGVIASNGCIVVTTQPILPSGVGGGEEPVVFVIDDDLAMRESLSSLFQSVGLRVKVFGSAPELLQVRLPNAPSCLVLDIRLPPAVVAALPKWRLMQVLRYIETNIGEPIKLANLAATAGLSRMYFAKQFRTTTGIRPHDFVLRKRIERAQQLLAATPDPLVDIALSVGFQTQAHFTTVFKKVVGSTPYQWRREQPRVA